MRLLKVPKFFHDILGEETQPLALALVITTTALLMGYLLCRECQVFAAAGLVRGGLAFILLADIIAGTIANFTSGTNDYYVRRSVNRWVFIAVHVQPVIIAWLLGFDLLSALALWGYVILAASVVNLLMGKAHQRLVAAALMSFGVFFALVLYGGEPLMMQVMSVFYVIKVVFSFGVNHGGGVCDHS